jgi:diguanylate cyclase (GGDEF)-like protein
MTDRLTPPLPDSMGDSEQMGSVIYRATIAHGLPVLVLSWTAIAVALALLVTAALITFVRGWVSPKELAVAAAVTGILTIPISYKIGRLLRDLERSRAALRHLAQVDALTGLANRGYFFRRAEQLLHPNAAPAWPLSALMIDVDRFKSINDEAGHAVGDQVLSEVARVLERNLRAGDFVARYGGEEFAAMLPTTNRTTAMAIAERMRMAVADAQLLQQLAQRIVTISIGVAETSDEVPVDAVMLAADRALYTAKAEGRNRCAFLDVASSLSATARARALKVATGSGQGED